MTPLKMYLKKIITETIEEISEAEGEGAMLIVANDNVKIDKFLARMDNENLQMEWRKNKSLKFVDKTLLRAMLIMDGSTLIKSSDEKNAEIKPRFLVYPHKKDKAFSVLHPGNTLVSHIMNNILDVLKGKGSRHHSAANLSMLLILNDSKCLSKFNQYLKNNQQNLDLPFRIITISADGLVKQWPNVFKKPKKGDIS